MHNVPVEQIHFHEVGDKDAVADIVAVCMLMERIAPDYVAVSPVCTGSGQIKCAHGILPVPAPATAYLLKGIPIYSGEIKGELCTPTGAALIRHFADSFGDMPKMSVSDIGYGMGKRDFPAANCLRVMLGETNGGNDDVLELSCNLDDMTAEEISYAMEKLSRAGAKDVFTIPTGMKKSRPGTLLTVLCTESDRDKMLSLIFKHTSTIGVREKLCRRYLLDRSSGEVKTELGTVRYKKSSGYGVSRIKFEYDDLAKTADKNNTTISAVREKAERCIKEKD